MLGQDWVCWVISPRPPQAAPPVPPTRPNRQDHRRFNRQGNLRTPPRPACQLAQRSSGLIFNRREWSTFDRASTRLSSARNPIRNRGGVADASATPWTWGRAGAVRGPRTDLLWLWRQLLAGPERAVPFVPL